MHLQHNLMIFLLTRLPGKPKFSLPHISVDTVLSYLDNLNVRKSAGLDNIRVSLLKMASPNLILPLCNIINKHVHDSFYLYLSTNDLICHSQFGFRKNYSCFTCLASLVNEWYNIINKDMIVGCIALDCRKAFDVLSHKILLIKLALYGCDELTLSWFHSYLSDRTRYVYLNDVQSHVGYTRQGEPQGSILGRLLFILFINDLSLIAVIPKYLNMLMIQLYALMLQILRIFSTISLWIYISLRYGVNKIVWY